MPTFYDCTPAPSPRRARIVLAEKGIAHDVKIIDLSKAEQLTAEFRAINPACTVPALVLHNPYDDFVPAAATRHLVDSLPAATLRVSHTLPPMVEPLPMVIRPRIVAPA